MEEGNGKRKVKKDAKEEVDGSGGAVWSQLSQDSEKLEEVLQFYSQFGPSRIPPSECFPILYSSKYNISFAYLERLHPFDSCKYRNIMNALLQEKVISSNQVIEPTKIPTEDFLKSVHTEEYIKSLEKPSTVAQITEIFIVAWFPSILVRNRVLEPMLYGTSGTILAARYAMQRGWAINLSGGYHHCSSSNGGGFCAYADITMCYKVLRDNFGVKNVMIVDLDAHQGNGHERDKLTFKDDHLFILDMYNKDIYPGDWEAARAIDMKVELTHGCKDTEYLSRLRQSLRESFETFTPDVIIYNAGTDILAGDPLGNMDISPNGVMQRDEIVFKAAFDKKIPIVMVLSGGYQRSNAQVIADSICNLNTKLSLLKA